MPQQEVPTEIDKLRKLLQEEIDTRMKGVVDASLIAEKLRFHIDDQLTQRFGTTADRLNTEIRNRITDEVARSRKDVESHYIFLKKTGTIFGLGAAALFVFLSFQEFRAIPDRINTAVTTAISGKREEITKLQAQVEERLQIVKEEQTKSKLRSTEAQKELEHLIDNAKTDIDVGKKEIVDKRGEVVELAATAVPAINTALQDSLGAILQVSDAVTGKLSDREQKALKEIENKKNQVIQLMDEKLTSINVIDNELTILRAKSAAATSVVGQLIDSGAKLLGDAIEKGREISKVRDTISRLEGQTKAQATRLVKELVGKIDSADAQLSAKLLGFEKGLESEVRKYKESLDDRVSRMDTTIETVIGKLVKDARFRVAEEIRRETGKFREAISRQALLDALEFMKERSFQSAMEKKVLANIIKYGSDDKITILIHFKESRRFSTRRRRLAPFIESALGALKPNDFSSDQAKTFTGLRLALGLKFDLSKINKEINDGLKITSKEPALENLFGVLEDASGTAGKKPPVLAVYIASRLAILLSSIATQHASRKIRIRAASYLVGALRSGSVGRKWGKNEVTKWIDDFLKRDGSTAEGSVIVLRALPNLPKNIIILASLIKNLSAVGDIARQQKLAKSIFSYFRKLNRRFAQEEATVNDVIATIRPHLPDGDKTIDQFLEFRKNLQIFLRSPRVKIDTREIGRLVDRGIIDVSKSFTGTPYEIISLKIRSTFGGFDPFAGFELSGFEISGTLRHASGGEAKFSIDFGGVEEGELAITKQTMELRGKISLGVRVDRSSEGKQAIFLYLRRL